MQHGWKRALGTAAILLLPFSAWAQFSFQGIGDLPGGENRSLAGGVSPDGSVVLGASASQFDSKTAIAIEAVVFEDGQLTPLGGLPSATAISFAVASSEDGSVIVGAAAPQNLPTVVGLEALRWDGDGVEAIGFLPGGGNSNSAEDVSADGSVIVGSSDSSEGVRAYRWQAPGPLVDLGVLDPADERSEALAVSADGSVVVGFSFGARGEAFRWTAAEGMVGMGPQVSSGSDSIAEAISADGRFIAGCRLTGESIEPFRYDVDTETTIGLGSDGITRVRGISADGSRVVGDGPDGRILWIEGVGYVDLVALLEREGLDLEGWELSVATGISDDGMVLSGIGSNPAGQREGWVATVPEPASQWLGLVALVAVALPRCRGRERRRAGPFGPALPTRDVPTS